MKAGISSGSCCRSPSMEMMISPRAASKPAFRAGVWPKFRRSVTIRTRESLAEMARSPIRDAAGQPAGQPPVPPLGTPSADNVITFLQFRNEGRDLLRIVLQIAIHGDDDLAARGEI